jgi:uncharacterized SAM-binding protein YcdF (DUF218 family)
MHVAVTRATIAQDASLTRGTSGGKRAVLPAVLACAGLSLATGLYHASCAFLTAALEDRFTRPTDVSLDDVNGFIALGGSHDRIVEAVRLARQYPNAKLIVTGAPPEDVAYAQSQGFAKDRLLIEPQAKTTFENALFSRQLLAPDGRQKWLIVTSAVHMPRAVGSFREAGFSALPWPVFEQQTGTVNTVETSRATLHEVFGLLEYWFLGRIGSPFPAPDASDKALMASR